MNYWDFEEDKSNIISHITVKDCNPEYHGKYRVCIEAKRKKVSYKKRRIAYVVQCLWHSNDGRTYIIQNYFHDLTGFHKSNECLI